MSTANDASAAMLVPSAGEGGSLRPPERGWHAGGARFRFPSTVSMSRRSRRASRPPCRRAARWRIHRSRRPGRGQTAWSWPGWGIMALSAGRPSASKPEGRRAGRPRDLGPVRGLSRRGDPRDRPPRGPGRRRQDRLVSGVRLGDSRVPLRSRSRPRPGRRRIPLSADRRDHRGDPRGLDSAGEHDVVSVAISTDGDAVGSGSGGTRRSPSASSGRLGDDDRRARVGESRDHRAPVGAAADHGQDAGAGGGRRGPSTRSRSLRRRGTARRGGPPRSLAWRWPAAPPRRTTRNRPRRRLGNGPAGTLPTPAPGRRPSPGLRANLPRDRLLSVSALDRARRRGENDAPSSTRSRSHRGRRSASHQTA